MSMLIVKELEITSQRKVWYITKYIPEVLQVERTDE